MAGRKDIDPASELVEDDEEQALPDSEESELDLVEAGGPVAGGRAALGFIRRHLYKKEHLGRVCAWAVLKKADREVGRERMRPSDSQCMTMG